MRRSNLNIPTPPPPPPLPWHEDHWPVIEYCRNEVIRQQHDVSRLEGIERVGWMLDGWSYALSRFATEPQPSMWDVVQIGMRVEREKNAGGLRCVNVRVGPDICPDWQRVPELLKLLFEQRAQHTPLEFYKALEGIHPFVDGNGRVGKIILNWMNGTLLNPVFPPADLFGTPIINP